MLIGVLLWSRRKSGGKASGRSSCLVQENVLVEGTPHTRSQHGVDLARGCFMTRLRDNFYKLCCSSLSVCPRTALLIPFLCI